uniref:Uncharacterized protein n=1 Tax=Plectus sambesii TaxID=2011161 RepID=A0A914XEJ1_9BILA
PPSLGSIAGLHKLFNTHSDLVQAAGRLFPTRSGQPLAKATTKTLTKENEGRRRRKIGSLVPAESPVDQSLDISLPEELLQTSQFTLLRRRLTSILTWPMLLSQVSTDSVEDFALPPDIVDKRPAATWPELVVTVPKDVENFELPPEFAEEGEIAT